MINIFYFLTISLLSYTVFKNYVKLLINYNKLLIIIIIIQCFNRCHRLVLSFAFPVVDVGCDCGFGGGGIVGLGGKRVKVLGDSGGALNPINTKQNFKLY